MSDKNRLTVTVLGKSYSLLSDEKSEIVEKAATIVDDLLKRMVGPSMSSAELIKRTTFVAIKVTVDMIKKERELSLIKNKTEALNELLRESSTSC